MKEIYERAKQVIAWVGEPSQDSAIGLKYLNMTKEQRAGIPSIQLGRKNTRLRRRRESSLNELFNRPYWRRVWVIQELAVASSAVVQCGNDYIEWENFAAAHDIWNSEGPYFNAQSFNAEARRTFSHIKSILEFQRKVREKEDISLVEAILETRHSESSDELDKVFALLGLCYDSSFLVPPQSYKPSLDDILTEITKNWIIKYDSLDILFCATRMGKHATSRCWIPDYQGKEPGAPAPRVPQISKQKNVRFSKSSFQGTSLRVEGKSFGTVVASTKVYSADAQHATQPVSATLPTKTSPKPPKVSQTDLRYYATDENITDAVWKSLCQGVYKDTDVKKYREMFSWLLHRPDSFRVAHDEIDHWLAQSSTFRIGQKRIGDLASLDRMSSTWGRLRKVAHPKYEFVEEEEFIQKITKTIVEERKKLVALSTGAIGVTDEHTQVGDTLCEIKGSPCSVVLRCHSPQNEQPPKYGIVGTGFVVAKSEVARVKYTGSSFRVGVDTTKTLLGGGFFRQRYAEDVYETFVFC
jgi:hypothetical protein